VGAMTHGVGRIALVVFIAALLVDGAHASQTPSGDKIARSTSRFEPPLAQVSANTKPSASRRLLKSDTVQGIIQAQRTWALKHGLSIKESPDDCHLLPGQMYSMSKRYKVGEWFHLDEAGCCHRCRTTQGCAFFNVKDPKGSGHCFLMRINVYNHKGGPHKAKGWTGGSVFLIAPLPTPAPSQKPTTAPSFAPSRKPTSKPTLEPSAGPTAKPSAKPSAKPTTKPSTGPSASPTRGPTGIPTLDPTTGPSANPTPDPPTGAPVPPTETPTKAPTTSPTACLIVTSGRGLYPGIYPCHEFWDIMQVWGGNFWLILSVFLLLGVIVYIRRVTRVRFARIAPFNWLFGRTVGTHDFTLVREGDDTAEY